MFPANAELDAVTLPPPAFGGHFDQLAHAVDVEADEGVAGEDTLVDIGREEARGIVAADAQRRLRQVVGAEAEEFRLLRDLARHQRGAGQFDHGADQIFDPAARLSEHFFRHPIDQRPQYF